MSEIWFPAKRVAKGQGETVTDVLNRALVQYIRVHDPMLLDDKLVRMFLGGEVAEDLWEAARGKARDEGTTLTAVIVGLLTQYVRGDYD